ncbi:hypothetical protein LguiA_026050 [Lonicera macranthoides]
METLETNSHLKQIEPSYQCPLDAVSSNPNVLELVSCGLFFHDFCFLGLSD